MWFTLPGVQLAAVQRDPDNLTARHPLALCSISHPFPLWTRGWRRWRKQGQQGKCGTGDLNMVKNVTDLFDFVVWAFIVKICPVSCRKETLGFVNTPCQILLLLEKQLILFLTLSTVSFRPSLTLWCHFLVAAHFSRWHLGNISV